MNQNIIAELNRLAKLQITNPNNHFAAGLFPSYRYNPAFNLTRADDNIFFSASIAFILKRHLSLFDDDERVIAQVIVDKLVDNYHSYRNLQRLSYNFWSRQPRKWFPNGNLLHRFKFFALPDDVDTSAMILLTNHSDSAQVQHFHELIKKHANGVKLTAQCGFDQFRGLPTYSTWLGEKMPIETDVCVLSNLMYLFLTHHIEPNQHDLAVRHLFDRVIGQRLYLSDPFKCSPEYPQTEIVVFHLSRLAGAFPEFFSTDNLKQLVVDAQFLHENSIGRSRMLLELSLHYLNKPVADCMTDVPIYHQKHDWWFTAGFLSVFGHRFLKKLSPYKGFHYRFYCEALHMALFIEHQLLHRQLK